MSITGLYSQATLQIRLGCARRRSIGRHNLGILYKDMSRRCHFLPLYCQLSGGMTFYTILSHRSIFLCKGCRKRDGELLNFWCSHIPDICFRQISLLPTLFVATHRSLYNFGIQVVYFWGRVMSLA